jgi:hypothetical protein
MSSPAADYVRRHKLEVVLQKAVNSLQKGQPKNPYFALAKYFSQQSPAAAAAVADAKGGAGAHTTEVAAAEGGDAAYAATKKFLAVSACGCSGAMEYPAALASSSSYEAAATGFLTATPPKMCTAADDTSLTPADDDDETSADEAGPDAITDHLGSPKQGDPPVSSVQEAVRRIKRAGGDMGVKKLVAQIKLDFPELPVKGVKVGAKEVRLAVTALKDVGLDTPPPSRAAA